MLLVQVAQGEHRAAKHDARVELVEATHLLQFHRKVTPSGVLQHQVEVRTVLECGLELDEEGMREVLQQLVLVDDRLHLRPRQPHFRDHLHREESSAPLPLHQQHLRSASGAERAAQGKIIEPKVVTGASRR